HNERIIRPCWLGGDPIDEDVEAILVECLLGNEGAPGTQLETMPQLRQRGASLGSKAALAQQRRRRRPIAPNRGKDQNSFAIRTVSPCHGRRPLPGAAWRRRCR